MDPLNRKIFPKLCFMKVSKSKTDAKFQLGGGRQARASHEFYAMFVKRGALLPVFRIKPETQLHAVKIDEIARESRAIRSVIIDVAVTRH